MPGPVEFSIVPPEPGAPVPVTVTPAEDPVSSRMMPLSALLSTLLSVLLDETLWNVTPAAPIVVSSITSAPSPELLSVLPGPVAVTAPLPVAVKAGFGPVLRVSVPVKAIVDPALSRRSMPPPPTAAVMGPPNTMLPPSPDSGPPWPDTTTAAPVPPFTLVAPKFRVP